MSQLSNVNKPIPVPTHWSKPYWDACKNHELHIQQCNNCLTYIMYPKLYCPHCLSDELGWVKSEGKGTVYSYSIVYNNPPTAFQGELPFVIAVVELSEGVRLTTNIIDTEFDKISCGIPVEVVFEDITNEITLPKFKVISEDL